MKRILFVFLAISFSLSSCVFDFVDFISGNGNVKVETRQISDFKAIEASNGLHILITFDKNLSLEVEADENLHDVILTEVNAGVLKVYTNRNIRNATSKNIRITVPSIEEFEVSSAADIKCENVLKVDRLDISVSSAGDLRLEADAKEIRAEASSSGSLDLRGEANELVLDASSAGSIDADKLLAKSCRVSASSAGSASVWVSEELNANASSAGNIRYKGDATNKKIDVSSAGSVTQK